MNVAQELGGDELYDYDILVKLLGHLFYPTSRVSASRSRFHGRSRRHHEDADSFADTITELCRLGYSQSSPELRQEFISKQFVRGQSYTELKKYLWVVIRTQKDRKLQTLIEVCTDFASLSPTDNLHRPAEQTFAVEEDESSEEMFAIMDRSQWMGPGVAEPNMPPSLAQMFALSRRMGYEMRLIARRVNQLPGSPRPSFALRSGISSTLSTGTVFLQNQVLQLRSDGAHAGALPKAGCNTTIQTAGVKYASRSPTTKKYQSTNGKRHSDREITHTGLNAIHRDISSSSSTDSSEHSSFSDSTHFTIHPTVDLGSRTLVPGRMDW